MWLALVVSSWFKFRKCRKCMYGWHQKFDFFRQLLKIDTTKDETYFDHSIPLASKTNFICLLPEVVNYWPYSLFATDWPLLCIIGDSNVDSYFWSSLRGLSLVLPCPLIKLLKPVIQIFYVQYSVCFSSRVQVPSTKIKQILLIAKASNIKAKKEGTPTSMISIPSTWKNILHVLTEASTRNSTPKQTYFLWWSRRKTNKKLME